MCSCLCSQSHVLCCFSADGSPTCVGHRLCYATHDRGMKLWPSELVCSTYGGCKREDHLSVFLGDCKNPAFCFSPGSFLGNTDESMILFSWAAWGIKCQNRNIFRVSHSSSFSAFLTPRSQINFGPCSSAASRGPQLSSLHLKITRAISPFFSFSIYFSK